jgi:hypothetical protein
MQVIIYLLHEAVNGTTGARSRVALRMTLSRITARPSRWQRARTASTGVVCGALLLGLFGGGVGATWSLALGFGAGIGALCGGLGMFALGVVLVFLGARAGRAFPLVMVSLAILVLEMAQGAIVWGARVALS